jgi:hypothetical protein
MQGIGTRKVMRGYGYGREGIRTILKYSSMGSKTLSVILIPDYV